MEYEYEGYIEDLKVHTYIVKIDVNYIYTLEDTDGYS